MKAGSNPIGIEIINIVNPNNPVNSKTEMAKNIKMPKQSF
jgi:hypothetical protein